MIVSYDLPRLSICVPTLGNYHDLHNTLVSIQNHTNHIDYEVVIVDSATRIRGFVGPMNQALEAARGNTIISLNDDVIVTEGWIDPLLAEAESGTWVSYPDQESTDGPQIICGWCVVFTREAYTHLKGYDDRFTLWCTDIDLVKRLHELKRDPVRVKIPIPLIHVDGGNKTVGRPDLHDYAMPTGMYDIELYRQKWGTDPLKEKHGLCLED